MRRVSKKVSWEIVKNILLPLVILASFLSLYVFYKTRISSYLSSSLQASLRKYLLTFLIIIIAFILQRLLAAIFGWYKVNVALKTPTTLDEELIPLIRRTSNVIVWAVAFMVILPLYGINISALIAALGVSSLAIALAAQDTISNIISGFMIMVDRPFRVGDRIKLPTGETVEVLDIGIRRSKFLSQDKAIIIVPNLELSKSKIVNYTYGEERQKQ